MTNNGTLTAAPVTNIETKQAAPACKFTITAVLRGFPITIEGEGRAGDLKIIVERLIAAGAEPPAAAPGQAEPAKPAGVPICAIHNNAPMKASSAKPGTFFCPKKNEDGSYCKSKG